MCFIVTEDSEGPVKRDFVIMRLSARRGECEVEEDLSFRSEMLQLRCWERSATSRSQERENLLRVCSQSFALELFLRARYDLEGSASQITGFREFPHEMFSPWYQQGSCFCHQMLGLAGRRRDLDKPLLQEDLGRREIESCELLASATEEVIMPASLEGFNQITLSMLSTCDFGPSRRRSVHHSKVVQEGRKGSPLTLLSQNLCQL